MNEIAEIGAPQEQEISQDQTHLERQQIKRKTLIEKIREIQIQLNSKTEDLEAFDNDIYRHRKDIQTLNKRHHEREERILDLQNQLRDLELSIRNFPEIPMELIEEKLVSCCAVELMKFNFLLNFDMLIIPFYIMSCHVSCL